MSANNKVVWSEGLFLRPQHFQQHERYLERQIELRAQPLRSHGWGFTELELERDLLAVGKFGLRRAAGVFPDGTPFCMPADDPLPPAFDVPAQARDQTVYLAMPLRAPGRLEFERSPGQEALARYQLREAQARDVTSTQDSDVTLELATLRARFLFSGDPSEGYARIPLASIIECRADRQVVLDAAFMATAMHAQAAGPLATFITELQGLLHQRGEALSGRVVASGRGGAAEIADFLLLQAVNRYEPLLNHWVSGGPLHPEDFYRLCVMAAGELATFTAPSKRPPELPPYRHEALRETFEPVIAALRGSLSAVLEQTAIPIPLEEKKYGIRVAVVADRTLFDTAAFVLAVRADLPAEELRKRFPAQIKIGPVEKIRELVNLQLPGVRIQPMAVAPRQIPYHAGFTYFELDRNNPLWKPISVSGGMAMHVGGEWAGLGMEFWAIRG